MPIKSYLACAHPGLSSSLAETAGEIPGCEVLRADNRDAVVIVTDTSSEDADAAIRERLEKIKSLSALTLVAAFDSGDDLISISQGAAAR